MDDPSPVGGRPLDRRSFLWLASGAAACASGLAACRHVNAARILEREPTDGALQLRLADLPELSSPGGAVKVRIRGLEDTILLWRTDADDYRATSIVCTHKGCDVEVAEGGRSLACPCHGSRYASDGSVLRGPAPSPLRRYGVRRKGDGLILAL